MSHYLNLNDKSLEEQVRDREQKAWQKADVLSPVHISPHLFNLTDSCSYQRCASELQRWHITGWERKGPRCFFFYCVSPDTPRHHGYSLPVWNITLDKMQCGFWQLHFFVMVNMWHGSTPLMWPSFLNNRAEDQGFWGWNDLLSQTKEKKKSAMVTMDPPCPISYLCRTCQKKKKKLISGGLGSFTGGGVERRFLAKSRVIIQIWTDVSCSFTLQVSVEGEVKDTSCVTGKYDLWARTLQTVGRSC